MPQTTKAHAETYDSLVIGAGAAGLMYAFQAAQQGLSVLVLEHGKQAGRKILISGGGRCNFTNLYASPENYISSNPHFCKSALSQYTQWDFIELVNRHKISWHEKTLGQLFCDESAKQIVQMLLKECQQAGVKIKLRTQVTQVTYQHQQYQVTTEQQNFGAKNLIVACGGLSMPKLGATPFGYKLAEQFGHQVLPVQAGLVPFTLHEPDKALFAELPGLSLEVRAENERISFEEALLFTHRGISGPSVLQISSYWQPGETILFNLLPKEDAYLWLASAKQTQPKTQLSTLLNQRFPKRFVQMLFKRHVWSNKNLADYADQDLKQIARSFSQWEIKPNGTEGYRTAEVTLGGVNVNEVSSKTMQSKLQPNLYFIGEVLDVTGWLGGYNFQWAWSSAYAAAIASSQN